MSCRYCYGSENELVEPCECRGSMRWVCVPCLSEWHEASGRRWFCAECERPYHDSGSYKVTPKSYAYFFQKARIDHLWLQHVLDVAYLTYIFVQICMLIVGIAIEFGLIISFLCAVWAHPLPFDDVVAKCVPPFMNFFP